LFRLLKNIHFLFFKSCSFFILYFSCLYLTVKTQVYYCIITKRHGGLDLILKNSSTLIISFKFFSMIKFVTSRKKIIINLHYNMEVINIYFFIKFVIQLRRWCIDYKKDLSFFFLFIVIFR